MGGPNISSRHVPIARAHQEGRPPPKRPARPPKRPQPRTPAGPAETAVTADRLCPAGGGFAGPARPDPARLDPAEAGVPLCEPGARGEGWGWRARPEYFSAGSENHTTTHKPSKLTHSTPQTPATPAARRAGMARPESLVPEGAGAWCDQTLFSTFSVKHCAADGAKAAAHRAPWSERSKPDAGSRPSILGL